MAGDIMRIRNAVGTLAATMLAASALVACSKDANTASTSAAVPRPKPAPAVKKGPSAEEQTAGMAAAPTLGKSSLPVDLKFELAERPKIGQALEINLALVSQIAGGPAAVQLAGADGLDASPGENQFDIPEVEAGEVYRHTLRLTPGSEGVLLVNLNVALKHDDVSDSKVFSIPVIVDR